MKKLLHITISGFVLLCFNGCGWGWFVPYSFQPSYHKFKKMCKMQYDFIFKGMGNVEAIHTELKMDLLMEFGIFGIMVDMNQLDIWATYILRSNGYIVIVFTKNGIKNI